MKPTASARVTYGASLPTLTLSMNSMNLNVRPRDETALGCAPFSFILRVMLKHPNARR
jgi:hypothetical protein